MKENLIHNLIHILFDSFMDSSYVLVISFIILVLVSYISNIIKKASKYEEYNLFFSSILGSIPQCSLPVVSGKMFLSNFISLGSLSCIFITCSDEAIHILLSKSFVKLAIFLILLKILISLVFGFIIDLFINKDYIVKDNNIKFDSCCSNASKFHKHFYHPLYDSVKLFFYCFIFSFVFNVIYKYFDLNNNYYFLNIMNQKFISPIIGVVIGLIPSCFSSILVTNLYISKVIYFGTFLSSMIVNAGVGYIYLFKNAKDKFHKKCSIILFISIILLSILCGYMFLNLENRVRML